METPAIIQDVQVIQERDGGSSVPCRRPGSARAARGHRHRRRRRLEARATRPPRHPTGGRGCPRPPERPRRVIRHGAEFRRPVSPPLTANLALPSRRFRNEGGRNAGPAIVFEHVAVLRRDEANGGRNLPPLRVTPSLTAAGANLSLGDRGEKELIRMALTPGRVLVVEDDPENRDALAEIFRLRGYDVTSAPDGASAIRRLAVGSRRSTAAHPHHPHPHGSVVGAAYLTTCA
jgi:CheY-like chemotaxis protein